MRPPVGFVLDEAEQVERLYQPPSSSSARASLVRQSLVCRVRISPMACTVPSLSEPATVSNAEQCDGLPAHFKAPAEPPALIARDRIAHAGRFFARIGADIRHGGTMAYYAIGQDYVQMRLFETFRDTESHAAHPRPRTDPLDSPQHPARSRLRAGPPRR